MELRHVDLLRGLQGLFVLAFAIVMVKGYVVIPAGMMPVEVNCSLRQSHAALPIAGERNHDRHKSQGGALPRIERHGPLRSLAKGVEIATKEVHSREFFPAHLAGGINLNGSPGGLTRPLERFLPRIEPIEILQFASAIKNVP